MTVLKSVVCITCFLLSTLPSFAQTSPEAYDRKWAVVDSLDRKKGLTESALEEANRIYTLATKEHNDAQQIKALVYRVSLAGRKTEDAGPKAITELEKATDEARQPAKAILQNITASAYWNYLQQNRYKFYNRTNTIAFDKANIDTWTIADFHHKIGSLYLASLKEDKLLKQGKLDDYNPIIVKGNVRHLRPTLYDLLAHSALNYFTSSEREVAKPANAFEIDDPVAFADAAEFEGRRFVTTDSSSLYYYAIQVFQHLTRLHLADARPDALIDLDIKRLNFIHTYSVLEDKEELYQKALARLTGRWGNEPAAAEAWYLQALQHAQKAGAYDPLKDTANRYEYAAAKSICEKVLTEKDSSEGKAHCMELLRNILSETLELQIETGNQPNQPLRSMITWRNFSALYGRIIKVDHTKRENLGSAYEDSYWQKLLRLPVEQAFSQSLPEMADYQRHGTEIKLEALPAGEYAFVASADSSFGINRHSKHPVAVVYFHVSSLSFVNYRSNYFVLDRETGQPIKEAAVQIWERSYDPKSGRPVISRAETYRTDSHGNFLLKERKNDEVRQLSLEINTGKDHLFIDNVVYRTFQESSFSEAWPGAWNEGLAYEKRYLHTYFFTDRSIYRPGQVVFFKGIVVTKDSITQQAKVQTKFRTMVFLKDVNQGKVDSLEVVTNDFGSYHGQFRIPENLLNGEFSIEDVSTQSGQNFSVEEYKRPAFYVGYDTLKENYRVGDSVGIKGYAKAFAGNNIDGALVKYRVVRQVHYPYPCSGCVPLRDIGASWGGWGLRGAETQEIAHGIAKTDAKGRFSINFVAMPDKRINKDKEPVFEYAVSADVTDINGETRSGEAFVRAGYKSLELAIDLPSGDHLRADSLRTLLIRATNLSGTPEQALATITVYALRTPARLLRERYWQAPDQFVLSREEYLRNFPHDQYGDETNKEKWEKTAKVVEMSDSTGRPLPVAGPAGKGLQPGWYLIDVRCKDSYGQEVKISRYVELYDGVSGMPGAPQYAWALQETQTVEPGERAKVDIGSSAGNLFVIRTVDRTIADAPKPLSADVFSFFTLDKEKKRTEFPVTEADRGGFGVADVFVKDNRIYTRQFTVNVPWTNKELTVSYASFREKVLPGSEEKWRITIKGQRADKTAAEAMLSMYDASLDQFKPQKWSVLPYPTYSPTTRWEGSACFSSEAGTLWYIRERDHIQYYKQYDALLRTTPERPRVYSFNAAAPARALVEKNKGLAVMAPDLENDPDGSKALMKDTLIRDEEDKPVSGEPVPVQVRKNFNETAFFFPDLRTDSAGVVSFSFTMPEALTRWKWMSLAHTKDLAFGYSEKMVVTQKQLMVQPNAPRFLREGDHMDLAVKVVNLTDSEMTGQVVLALTDPTTGETADGWFTNRQPNQYFTVAAGQSAVVSFPLVVPFQYNRPLTYRIVAQARNYSDGEEATLPVVSNRMLVTETLPLNLRGNGTRKFTFDKLLQSGSSETLNHHALTVEFTTNPAWYAVQSLPYLMEYPYECAEQTFNRFYANALASKIASSSPRLQEVFARWRTQDTAALLSNLQKNQELKTILLEETPWVLQGKTEAQQKKNIALLFDLNRMSKELEATLGRLTAMQSASGGFAWFKGGYDDLYITQYILTGIGRLQKLQVIPAAMAPKVAALVKAALPYVDGEIKRRYEEARKAEGASAAGAVKGAKGGAGAGAVKGAAAKATADGVAGAKQAYWIGELPVQYLYMRSFFSDYGLPGAIFPAMNYYRKKVQQSWVGQSKYMQGMIALALFRTGDVQTAKDIIKSLQQNAIRDEDRGMYWKGMEGGYYWYEAPIEIQSVLIEAFREISGDAAVDRDLKTWLLTQKQTHNWKTTKATADACYALLLGGQDWLSAGRDVEVKLGEKTVSFDAASGEAGTGYNKKVFDGPFVSPSMGNITVTMRDAAGSGTGGAGTGTSGGKTGAAGAGGSGGSPAWGAVYWQYFDILDRITPPGGSKAPLKLTKKLFIERNTDRGRVLEPVGDKGILKPGDKVIVRIELQADRSMEYVHMKDMRAACMEPVNVLSQYKWQGGLGYYESTKDASTDFFFASMPRGTYVFEYPLLVGQAGDFSNGITSIECMYAPEFAYHSEGIRVNVEGAP